MATDQSPPRTRLIVTLTIVTVVCLAALKPIFDSYFIDMFEGEAKAKLSAPDELRKQREEEQRKLTEGPLSIENAMGQLARGREGAALISPVQSNDNAPLVGWSRLVADGGVAPTFTSTMNGAAGAMQPAGVAGDASAPMAADASVTTTTAAPAPPHRAGDAAP